MKKLTPIGFLLIIALVIFSTNSIFAASFWVDDSTVAFYPSNMTYVDRESPKEDFGSEPYLKVGDAIGNHIEGEEQTIYDAVNAMRTYFKFSQSELSSELEGRTITGATLNMYLGNVADLPGTYTTYDSINVLQVTGANSYGYMQNLTWDKQAERNVVFSGGMLFASLDFNVTGETPGLRTWENAASGNGTIASMVQLWLDDPDTNYGVVIGNDFDGEWEELVNGTKYDIGRPGQMNELEATFSKTEGTYPYLRVTTTVVPEPASCLLALLGMGALGIAAKRKKT